MNNKIEVDDNSSHIPTGEVVEDKTEKAAPDYRNPLPCGCGIKGVPYLDPLGTGGYEYKDKFINFCPTHRAAPSMYAALELLLSGLPVFPDPDTPDIGVRASSIHLTVGQIRKAQAALALAYKEN